LNLLALDTTGVSGSIAVLKDGRLLSEKSWRSDKSHTSELPHQALQICQAAKVALNEIEVFGLSIGPGSFTGIRIGLAFVKGLALGRQKTVVGVSSLMALALGVEEEGLISPWIDARRGEIYGALFQKRGEEMTPLMAERATTPKAFLEEMVQQMNPASTPYFLGSGAQVYREKIHSIIGSNVLFLNDKNSYIRASIVGREAWKRFKSGGGDLGGVALLPQYLRASEAETKLDGLRSPI